jgi:hypothetical protein
MLALSLALVVLVPPYLVCARYWPVPADTRAGIAELLDASAEFRSALMDHGLCDLSGPGLPRVADGRLVVRREWPWSRAYVGWWRYQPEDGSPRITIALRVDLATRELTLHPAHA